LNGSLPDSDDPECFVVVIVALVWLKKEKSLNRSEVRPWKLSVLFTPSYLWIDESISGILAVKFEPW
jgi:hypothetical protein